MIVLIKNKRIMGIAVLSVFVFLIFTSVWTFRRTLRGSNDFDTFYGAGKAVSASSGIYDEVADMGRFDDQKGPFLYPPAAAFFFAIFAFLPMELAAIVWNALNLIFFFLILLYSIGILEIKKNDFIRLFQESQIGKWMVILSDVTMFIILLDNLSMAQVNIFVCLMCVLSWRYWTQNKPFWSGFFIAIAVMVKVAPIFIIVYYFIRKSWRTCVSFCGTCIIVSFLLPSLLWGVNKTVQSHQQWFHRLLKPIYAGIAINYRNAPKEDLESRIQEGEMQKVNLARLLVEKNQFLGATLSRFLLKNRNDYGYGKNWYAIYRVRRYEGLPVLFGGIQRNQLVLIITLIQILLIMFVFGLLHQNLLSGSHIQVSFVLLSMTLLTTSVRSHQYVYWIFPLLFLIKYWSQLGKGLKRNMFAAIMIASHLLYYGLALPYGQAAGMGTWANVVLWMTCCILMISRNERALKLNRIQK